MTQIPPHGLLVVDKPPGPTSHDVVAEARRRFSTRAVGHAGTLDPMATGVLLLLFGEARKLSGYLTGESKTYLAVVRFGVSTDTLDAEGSVTAEAHVPSGALDPERVEAALAGERERTAQVPPAVSSIKVRGERAHRLSRRGEPPELAARSVRVERLELVARTKDGFTVEVTASKGYYVRSLARDLGDALGVPAHLAELRRSRSGAFTLADATGWPPAGLAPLFSVTEAARRCLPGAELTDDGVLKTRRGQALGTDHFIRLPEGDRPHAWFDAEGRVIALGVRTPEGFRVLRGFVP